MSIESIFAQSLHLDQNPYVEAYTKLILSQMEDIQVQVRLAAIRALKAVTTAMGKEVPFFVSEHLTCALSSTRPDVRWATATACQELGVEHLGPAVEASLVSLFDDEDIDVRIVALAAIEGAAARTERQAGGFEQEYYARLKRGGAAEGWAASMEARMTY